MKKLIALFAGLFLMSIAVQNVNAQNGSNNCKRCRNQMLTIIEISISKSADLHFGDIVARSTAGTVTVTPAGARSFGGGAVIFFMINF
jgi:hypothetical protein